MAKKPEKKRDKPKKSEYYKIESGKIIRLRKPCPKCGSGVFLSQHKNRLACGTCGYSEFFKK